MEYMHITLIGLIIVNLVGWYAVLRKQAKDSLRLAWLSKRLEWRMGAYGTDEDPHVPTTSFWGLECASIVVMQGGKPPTNLVSGIDEAMRQEREGCGPYSDSSWAEPGQEG